MSRPNLLDDPVCSPPADIVVLRFVLLLLFACGCASRLPVPPGKVVQIGANSLRATNALAAPLRQGDPGYHTTLQVRWLGTACYLIQLGDQAILTDPFFSHQSLLKTALGGKLHTDPEAVRTNVSFLPVRPAAIFVTHSHYDHLLDAAEALRLGGWGRVPVYGGQTTRNILNGYDPALAANCRIIETNADWLEIAPGIEYRAVSAVHGRQLAIGPLLYPGELDHPRDSPPDRPCEFPVGQCYAFLFRFNKTFILYLTGAAHSFPQGLPSVNCPRADIALLCVPTWRFSRDYPAAYIRALRPEYVVASHFGNFFQTNRGPLELVPFCALDGFIAKSLEAADYPQFQQILLPYPGGTLLFDASPDRRKPL